MGRADIWRVPAFEKAAIGWLMGNWHLTPAEVDRLGWADAEPGALPSDFEREVVSRLRRQQTSDTNLSGANFEGVKLRALADGGAQQVELELHGQDDLLRRYERPGGGAPGVAGQRGLHLRSAGVKTMPAL
jgi:hypothetical protein